MKNRKLKPRWVISLVDAHGLVYLNHHLQYRTLEEANVVMAKLIFHGEQRSLKVVRKLYRKRAPRKPRWQ